MKCDITIWPKFYERRFIVRIFVISGYHGVGKTSVWSEVCTYLKSDGIDIAPIGEFARGILQDGCLLNEWPRLFDEDYFNDFYFEFELLLGKMMKHFWLYWYDKGKVLICDRSLLDVLTYCQTYLDPHLWERYFKDKMETELLLSMLALKHEMLTFVLRREGINDEKWIENFYSLLDNYDFPYKLYCLAEDFRNRKAIVQSIVRDIENSLQNKEGG